MTVQSMPVTELKVPADHAERTYAGCLGKVLGVYLGRPFEGWTHKRILAELGPVEHYVADRLGVPLVVTDDDISGTFTFLRALSDYGPSLDLTPAQIGQTWLNYIVEKRTILWWGGVGNSTEHTAYVRLKNGIAAPRSGSIALNGQVVAEQIGAQIFIDGWAMVSPGDPAQAAELARRAGSVSHDGEAVHSAQVLAAMEAQAFVESDIDRLLDTGLSFVPPDCLIAQLVADVRRWHREDPDWQVARDHLERRYGYHLYGGDCHTVPNFGVIILALLYGGGDWDRSMMIVNTSGWDTDCNSGNLGCLLGIRNGLGAFDQKDWRGPVADRIYLPTADGGRAVTDVATEAVRVINLGRALRGDEPFSPRDGARFSFAFPGSVQGFNVTAGDGSAANVAGDDPEQRSLRISATGSAQVAATTPTFIPPEGQHMPHYGLVASPALSPGQRVRASVRAASTNTAPVEARLVVTRYGADDLPVEVPGPQQTLAAGEGAELAWVLPGLGGQPIASVGVVLVPQASGDGAGSPALDLDWLDWDGQPEVTLGRPADGGTMWRRAWVDAVDDFDGRWPESYRFAQNEGRGLLIHGTREWADLVVSADLTPHLASEVGLAVRVQGLRRYYAVLLGSDGVARLLKSLDGERVLATAEHHWELGRTYQLTVEVTGNRIRARVDGLELFDVQDAESPLLSGAIGLAVADGRATCETVTVRPGNRG